MNKLLISFFLFISCVSGLAIAQDKRIIIVPSSEASIYQAAAEEVIKVLGEVQSGKNPVSAILPLDEFVVRSLANPYKKSDLIVTIGTTAANAAIKRGQQSSVLSLLIPKQTFEAILDQNKINHPNSQYSAIYIDQPIKRRLKLDKTIFPEKVSLGVIFGPVSSKYKSELAGLLSNDQLFLVSRTVDQPKEFAKVLDDVLDSSDVVMAVPDPVVYNSQNTKWLIYLSYKRRIPVIGFSESYVKAGALAGLYSTPENIGYQAGKVIRSLITKTSWPLPKGMYPEYYEISINSSIAKSLRIEMNDYKQLRNPSPVIEEEDL